MHRGLRFIAQRTAVAHKAASQRVLRLPSARSLSFSQQKASDRTGEAAAAARATQPETATASASAAAAAPDHQEPQTSPNHISNTSSSNATANSSTEVSSNVAPEASVTSSSLTGKENETSSNTSNTSSSNGSSGSSSSSDEGGGSWWRFQWTWPRGLAAVSAASFVGWFGYEFVQCGYSLGKAEWVISKKIKRLLLGEPLSPHAVADSKFQIGLSEDVQNELALYFLQLDLDKPNGVRRSDALALAEMLGFDAKNKICGAFVQRGKGRPIEERRSSGCSLQELGELIEALALNEEATAAQAAAEGQQQQQQQQDGEAAAKQQQEGADDPNAAAEGTASAGDDMKAGLPGEETQERLLRLLREANGKAKPTAWTIPQTRKLQWPEASRQLQQQQQKASLPPEALDAEEASPEEAREELELRLAIAKRTLDDLKALGARRGYSEAERKRHESLEDEQKAIEAQLRDLAYA